jgi:hypothetical protein
VTTAPSHSRADEAGDELRTMLRDLARSHRHREPFTRTDDGGTSWAGHHTTFVPPLLVQALDTLTRIDLGAARWVRDMGEDDPGSTIGCVVRLGALLPSAKRCHRQRAVLEDITRRVTCCTWHAVEADVRRWWTQARIVAGWDSPPWRPDNTCPVCGVRRALRVRLSDRVGFCTECHETWAPQDYQSLAEHIRLESEAEGTRIRLRRGPCLCVWPEVPRPGLVGLCPRCGSASCRWAVYAAGEGSS